MGVAFVPFARASLLRAPVVRPLSAIVPSLRSALAVPSSKHVLSDRDMRMPPLSMPSMYSLRPLSSGKNNAVPPKGKRKDEDDDSDDEKEGETRREKIKEKLIHLKEEIKEEIDETKVSPVSLVVSIRCLVLTLCICCYIVDYLRC